jgi:hypothetical protein
MFEGPPTFPPAGRLRPSHGGQPTSDQLREMTKLPAEFPESDLVIIYLDGAYRNSRATLLIGTARPATSCGAWLGQADGEGAASAKMK